MRSGDHSGDGALLDYIEFSEPYYTIYASCNVIAPRLIDNCHYLQRVGGWNKLYFVLQNSLLMSYNSRDEYEKKLVSFKDVICLIPGNTVLLPSLEPRFTIASNQNTFYTFVSWHRDD